MLSRERNKRIMTDINTASVKPQLRLPGHTDLTPTLMLLLLSRASALGMYPFGIAFFAAAFDKRVAYMGVAAGCIGIATAAGVQALPQYIIAYIIYWLFIRVYRRNNEAVRSLACGVAVVVGGGVMMLSGYHSLYDVFLMCTEAIISALMYVVFKNSHIIAEEPLSGGRMSAEEYVSAAITIGCIAAGMYGIRLWQLSFSNIFAVYAVMICALNSTLPVAACTGMCIGFIVSMTGPDAIVMMGVYGLGAIFASFMNSFKRIGCLIGYVGGTAVTLIYVKNIYALPISLTDTFAGGLLFMLTPRTVMEYLRSFFSKSTQVESVSPEQRMREYLSMRLNSAGTAFGSLHESFVAVSDGRLRKYSDDIGTILDEAARRTCLDCKMCGKCWQTDFRKTYKNILELIGIIETEGGLTLQNAPEGFCAQCGRADSFIEELGHVYELYKRDVLRRSDAVTARNLIAEQYNELSGLFSDMAEQISSGFVFLEDEEERIVDGLDKLGIMPYEVSVVEAVGGTCEIYLRLPPAVKHTAIEGVLSDVLRHDIGYTETKDGLSKYVSKPCFSVDTASEQQPAAGVRMSGDSIGMFCADNRFFAILADGMGSGCEAQYESNAAVRLLSEFLKAGFSPKTALGILNSAMCLNMDKEIYSTIDLLEIDLYSGCARLYKIGSAETVIYSNGEINTVSSASIPMGILSDIRLENKRMELCEGDVVLLMTDGITEAGYAASKTDWIKQLAVKPYESMSQLTSSVMDGALRKEHGVPRDDMSIVAIRLIGI